MPSKTLVHCLTHSSDQAQSRKAKAAWPVAYRHGRRWAAFQASGPESQSNWPTRSLTLTRVKMGRRARHVVLSATE